MKHQQPFLAIALLFATSITGLAKSLSEEQRRAHLQLLQSKDARETRLSPLDRAYLDAHELLNHDGTCRQFYGGSAAMYVLDELTIRLQARSLRDPRIGLRMSGPFTSFGDSEKGISYRLFEKAEINYGGPFYKALSFRDEPRIPRIGSFGPNTREARVLILLHELAHLILGPNRKWLIPNDGDNPWLSHENTEMIESRCGEQIRGLQKKSS
jgi:hypothetical protein